VIILVILVVEKWIYIRVSFEEILGMNDLYVKIVDYPILKSLCDNVVVVRVN
jgi:hypothetical protein